VSRTKKNERVRCRGPNKAKRVDEEEGWIVRKIDGESEFACSARRNVRHR
jgi:hypothetical protein